MNRLRRTTLDRLQAFIEGFCFALVERRAELFLGLARVCDELQARRVSLSMSRATRRIDTLGPPTPRFWPRLSVVSPSHPAWVIEGLFSLNRSHPPGVGFGEGR
jgi:hypothetical protein